MTNARNIKVQTPGTDPKPEQMPPQEAPEEQEAPKVGRSVEPEQVLPTQAEIDAVELKRPVLTKDGWLVPSKFGSPPHKVF